VVHGHRQGHQPVPGGARPTSVIADHRRRLPIPHHPDRDPPKALHPERGHVDAPLCVGLGGSGCAPRRRPLRLALQGGRDHEVMRPHQAPPPLLVHRPRLHEAQLGPAPAVAPERVLRLERLPALEPRVMTLGDQEGAWPAPPSHSSLLVHAHVSSPKGPPTNVGGNPWS
jgi:hypothetical protein